MKYLASTFLALLAMGLNFCDNEPLEPQPLDSYVIVDGQRLSLPFEESDLIVETYDNGVLTLRADFFEDDRVAYALTVRLLSDDPNPAQGTYFFSIGEAEAELTAPGGGVNLWRSGTAGFVEVFQESETGLVLRFRTVRFESPDGNARSVAGRLVKP